jgi:hypothetical protein
LLFNSTDFSYKYEKRKSALPSAVQVKNQRKTIGIEQKLAIINRLEKGERIVDICRNVRRAHSIVHAICDNAVRIKESAKSGTNCLCSKTSTVLSKLTIPKAMDVSLIHFCCIRKKLIKILYRNVRIQCKNVYILYIQYIYILQVCTYSNGIVRHYKRMKLLVP